MHLFDGLVPSWPTFGINLEDEIPGRPDTYLPEAYASARAQADEVIVVDLTRSGIDLPVVRIVVPGLEGCSDEPDYVPGPRARARSRR